MKKITAFAFCLTLAFFLAACGKAPVSSTGGASLPPASSGSAASAGTPERVNAPRVSVSVSPKRSVSGKRNVDTHCTQPRAASKPVTAVAR